MYSFVHHNLNSITFSFDIQNENDDEAENSGAQKRCIDTTTQRWKIRLFILGVFLIILFFIIPDFIIIWELQLRKQVESLLK